MQRSGIREGRCYAHSRIPLHSFEATLAIVQPADDVADLIEQPGLAPSRDRILMPVHAVFPYGGARAPSAIPFIVKALSALPTPPPGYNTAPTRPASTPTVSQPIQGAKPGRRLC